MTTKTTEDFVTTKHTLIRQIRWSIQEIQNIQENLQRDFLGLTETLENVLTTVRQELQDYRENKQEEEFECQLCERTKGEVSSERCAECFEEYKEAIK